MLNVLVVDDEPFVRVSMAAFKDWNSLGYDFRFEAGNGQQALKILAEHPEIDIVFLDLAMPVMGGIALLEALPSVLPAKRAAALAIVILSAHDDFHLVRKAFTLGAQDYLLKSELDGDSLEALLAKTAAHFGEARYRLEASSEESRAATIAERFLRGSLAGRAFADSELETGKKAANLEYPLTLVSIWIEDFEIAATRYPSEEFARFDALFLRSIQQAVARYGDGRAVKTDGDSAAVFAWPINEPGRLAAEIKDSLERYLSLRMDVRFSAPVVGLDGIREVWEAMVRSRRVLSRIVVLAKRYLREHLSQPVSLQELADFVGVSRNHLSWDFSRETGETISAYHSRLKVEEACRLLATTNLKVYQIAGEVGYANVENFNRVFKRITGASPTRWAEEPDSRVFRDLGQEIGS